MDNRKYFISSDLVVRLILEMKFWILFVSLLQYFIMDLLVKLLGVQIGAPYKITGLISESNSVLNALNDNLERIIVRLKPKNALIALVFSVDWAILKLPDLCRSIPR